jgi:hypothetical protein
MYAINSCEEWRYGSKPRVSGSDVGLGLWRRVVEWMPAFWRTLVPSSSGLRRPSTPRRLEYSAALLWGAQNSQSAAVLFLKLGTRWKWVATFTLRPPYFAGKNHPVSRPFWPLQRSPQCRREGLAVRKGPRGPTVLHIFLCLSVVPLFFPCID